MSYFNESDIKIKQTLDLFYSPWSRLMEVLLNGNIFPVFQSWGFDLYETYTHRKGSYNSENYEYDIIAKSQKEIIVIEVRTKFYKKDVVEFVKKMKKTRKYLRIKDHEKIFGAIAYQDSNIRSEVYAQNQKLFVIRATGDSAAIINNPDFVPGTF